MPAAARSKQCSSVSAWLGVFASIAMSSKPPLLCQSRDCLDKGLQKPKRFNVDSPS